MEAVYHCSHPDRIQVAFVRPSPGGTECRRLMAVPPPWIHSAVWALPQLVEQHLEPWAAPLLLFDDPEHRFDKLMTLVASAPRFRRGPGSGRRRLYRRRRCLASLGGRPITLGVTVKAPNHPG